ncbi:MarR family transcriptional regulator [Orenia metallireducens]|uniref:Transcriptional regulator, MarR family n=1 Tax=Orenia metallireducens TaxID=1413210 RepID=A0A285I6C5_9FIRM|nr:ROK family transcriptional regulator [Orenia metallireducens]PRX22459.1 MarR family transcriptional regulator [Orenia metallireducens]SNY43552.1 transcriptional regulator, MarR family [Orenia metallireducens]
MNGLLKGSFDLMKQLNISVILEVIRTKNAISRADIAEITGLTPASVSKITKDLMERGFIQESGLGESSGGRPPVLLTLNPKAGYVIGVNLGPGFLEIVLTDLEANILAESHERLEKIDQDYILESLFTLIENIISNNKIAKEDIIGIGMAVHGVVNSQTGISVFAPHYHWKDVAIKDLIEEKFDIPTFIDNDVRAMALGESWFGVAKGIDNFITINISNGIGSGIMIGGKLHYGVDYSAGELGHTIVDNDGPKCSCGNYGCLESLASNTVIVERARKLIKQGVQTGITSLVKGDLAKLTTTTVCNAANQGDDLAQQLLKDIGRYLGIGITNLLNILNPRMIVIVGDIVKAKSYVFSAILETVEVRALETIAKDTKIVATDLGKNAATIGGVTLVLKELFKGAKLLEKGNK